MFWSTFKSIFLGLSQLLFFVMIPLALALLLFVFLVFFQYIRLKKKLNIKPKKSVRIKEKKNGFLKDLFFQVPQMIAYDMLTTDPDAFQEFGLHMVCGEQGAGKTITVVYLLEKWRRMYPKMEIYTNMGYQYETGELLHWKDMVSRNNGIYGVAEVIDEMQTWFSNAESKNMPLEMLGEISQQRKQKKCIVGTAQVFSRVSKAIREQTHYVYLPKTFFNVITIVRRAKASEYIPEKDKFKRYHGFFCFVHTKELRESYDTFKRISRYKDQEFAVNEQLLDRSFDFSEKNEKRSKVIIMHD